MRTRASARCGRAAATLAASALGVLAIACESPSEPAPVAPSAAAAQPPRGTERAPSLRRGEAEAVFAGGCFWCMEAPFESIPGVSAAVSGYTGGRVDAPRYEDVSAGRTGHVEAVRVVYDPSRVGYAQLLEVFLHNVDPTQDDGQFCDRGEQYRSAIFVRTQEERRLATEALERARATLGRPVVTTVRDASTFWVAEAYHQDFYRTNPSRYASYRRGCGRDARLRTLWGDAAGH